MTKSVDELLEHAIEFAHEFYTKHTDMMPQLMFETESGPPTVVEFPFRGDTEKYEALDLLRDMLHAHNATSYTIMNEGWVSKHPTADAAAKAVRPSLDPNRTEVLSILVVQRSGEGTGALYEIKREGERVVNLIDTGTRPDTKGSYLGRLFEEK